MGEGAGGFGRGSLRDLISFPVIHAVTDSAALLMPDFFSRAEAVMRTLGSRGALQLRTSRLSGRAFHEIAEKLSALQAVTGCWLIVNDRVDVACSVGARGIQLASHSLRMPEARIVAPDVPAGISIHSVDEARAAESEGAAWCVAGTVFETPSHEGRAPARIQFIQQVIAAVGIPVIAIGGIQPADIRALKAVGAHGVATIRGAGWDHRPVPGLPDGNPPETRRFPPGVGDSGEPVARYISAYDADDGSGSDDRPDSERSGSRSIPG